MLSLALSPGLQTLGTGSHAGLRGCSGHPNAHSCSPRLLRHAAPDRLLHRIWGLPACTMLQRTADTFEASVGSQLAQASSRGGQFLTNINQSCSYTSPVFCRVYPRMCVGLCLPMIPYPWPTLTSRTATASFSVFSLNITLKLSTAGENDNPQGVVSTSDGRVVRAFHRFTLVDQSTRGRDSRDLTKGRRRDQGAVKISCARQVRVRCLAQSSKTTDWFCTP